MNSLIESEFPLPEGSQTLSYDLMNMLTDADLAYKLPGDNPTLGELCREMGEIEHAYIQSFKTLKHDLSYRHPDPGIASSVERLRSWYAQLDAEFETVIGGFSEEDLQNKQIERGGFAPSPFVQFQIYREAVLIFYAKASVYLKALGKPYNDKWRAWVG
jgi:hypothetical protein